MPEKILLDTDIGTDIDDAVCLTYLLANPNCQLMGITTVTGEAQKRAMMASALCKVAGKDIPIFPGNDNPLLVEQKQKVAVQAVALDRWDHETRFPKGEAIPFLRKTIHENPGEITLLTVGPLTNIGLLFSVDPEIPGLLKKLVLMCGSYFEKTQAVKPLEWNARVDPHATAIVFRSGVPVLRAIGLDVTLQVFMASQEFVDKFDYPVFKPVFDFSKIWFTRHPGITFHDPLAAATVFRPDICTYRKGEVEIVLDDQNNLGRTQFKAPAEENGSHEVAATVDKKAFFDEYMSVF